MTSQLWLPVIIITNSYKQLVFVYDLFFDLEVFMFKASIAVHS